MKTLDVGDREEWRAWLQEHHDKEEEIWVVYYRKASGKPRIPYNDAVEEALCFGWIDSQQRGIDEERFAQRFSPRKPGSPWSEMNKQRLRKLATEGKMTSAGLAAAQGVPLNDRFKVSPDIEKAIKEDRQTWQNFRKFPESYRRIRIAFIEAARNRPEEFVKRLNYFLKMTAQNKRFGYVKEFADKD